MQFLSQTHPKCRVCDCFLNFNGTLHTDLCGAMDYIFCQTRERHKRVLHDRCHRRKEPNREENRKELQVPHYSTSQMIEEFLESINTSTPPLKKHTNRFLLVFVSNQAGQLCRNLVCLYLLFFCVPVCAGIKPKQVKSIVSSYFSSLCLLVCSVPACVNIWPSSLTSPFYFSFLFCFCWVIKTGGNGTIYTLPLMGVKDPPLHHNPFQSLNTQWNAQWALYVTTSVCRHSKLFDILTR